MNTSNRAAMTASRRRWSFSLMTMLAVVTVLAAIWWACVTWPVKDGFDLEYTGWGEGFNIGGPHYRPPTAREAILRVLAVGVGMIAALPLVVLILRRRSKRAPGAPNPGCTEL
jgi:hypothetical protein